MAVALRQLNPIHKKGPIKFFFKVKFSQQDFARTTLSFLGNVLWKIIKEESDQDLTYSLDTLKTLSIKSVPEVVIRGVCGTWHCLNMVTSIHSIQKSTRNSQKLGNKLANEQNARRSNAVFSRKKTRKNKMNSSNPSYQSMDCVIKWVIRLINSIRIFFIFFQFFSSYLFGLQM